MILINKTKIELTTKILFENDFRDIKVVNVVKTSNDLIITNDSMTTSVLTIINFNESLTKKKFAKKKLFQYYNRKILFNKKLLRKS